MRWSVSLPSSAGLPNVPRPLRNRLSGRTAPGVPAVPEVRGRKGLRAGGRRARDFPDFLHRMAGKCDVRSLAAGLLCSLWLPGAAGMRQPPTGKSQARGSPTPRASYTARSNSPLSPPQRPVLAPRAGIPPLTLRSRSDQGLRIRFSGSKADTFRPLRRRSSPSMRTSEEATSTGTRRCGRLLQRTTGQSSSVGAESALRKPSGSCGLPVRQADIGAKSVSLRCLRRSPIPGAMALPSRSFQAPAVTPSRSMARPSAR